MDKKINDTRLIKPKHWKFIIPVLLLLVVSSALVLREPGSTYRTDREKLSIEKVTYASFEDYIRLTGVVEPISVIYLDATEGGIVEEILIEEGSMLKKGDVILKLSNTNLNLNILNSEAQLAEKANLLRETYINMEQQKLSLQRDLLQLEFDLLQKKRAFEQNKTLYEQGFISTDEYLQSEEEYGLTQKLMKLSLERNRQDSIFRKNQIKKINLNLENMERNMQLVYQRQENLQVKAPYDGQLGLLDATLGESIGQGQRIGQVNVLTSYKIKAKIDEHYIDRVQKGLEASFIRQADTFHMEVKKIYPAVRDGRFEVDLVFTAHQPENIRTGQSYNFGLQLGETQQSLLLPKGGFFQSTGGQWVYVLTDEQTAVKRAIRIGKQNPRYYEVLEGLEEGEQVITSGYDTFGDSDKLVLN
jgi:HlyD family secretion protein